MKKTLIIMLCATMLVAFTGCGKKKTVEDDKVEVSDNNTDDKQTSDEQNDDEQNDKVDKKVTYYCNAKDDGSGEFYFYYVNDDLSTIEYTFLMDSDDDYNHAKEIADNYDGITVTKRADGYIIIEVDIKQGGLLYLNENYSIFKDLKSVKWDDIELIMKENYNCSNKGALEPLTGTGNIK